MEWESILYPVLDSFTAEEQGDLTTILEDEIDSMFFDCFTLSVQRASFDGRTTINAEGLHAKALATADRLRLMVTRGSADVHDREDIFLLDDLPDCPDEKDVISLSPEHCVYLTRATNWLCESRFA